METLLLRVSEVAKAIGSSKSTVYELIHAGAIPSIRLGKSIRVPVDGLKSKLAELQKPA